MKTLIRTPATVVWAVLVAATVITWMLGTGHALPNRDHTTSSVLILVVAFAKVRFVGLYFMELKDAPIPLRGIFEAYCLIVCGLVIGAFLLG
jgi:hypothetical protein